MIRFRALIVLAVTLSACAAGATSARAAFLGFQSPTKNIGCAMDSVHGAWSVRCDIAQRTWSPPPKPRSCPLDFGQGVEMGSHGAARYACAGDTTLGQGPVLPYGHSIARGAIRCTSTMAAMTCVNTRHHHGFVLSRASVRLY